MISIPFIYFSLLSLFLYRKHKGISVAFIISLLFAASSFFSILLEVFDLRSRDTYGYKITPYATAAYCGLLTMCMLPLIVHPNTKIVTIYRVRNDSLLRALAWISFFWFIIVVLLSFPQLISGLSGNIQETKNDFNHGDGDSYIVDLPTIIKVPVIILTNSFSCSWILIFLAFYCKIVQIMPSKYFWLYFVASFSSVYLGALSVDRAKTTYWILSFIIMFYFFKPYMKNKLKKDLQKIFYVFVAVAIFYLFFITISRFGERDYGSVSGSQGGIIYYLGQNFINFCFFFDNYSPPIIDLSLIFPFTFKFILGQEVVNAAEIQEFMSLATGIETGVFYTFIGSIIVATGVVGAIIYCVSYTLLSSGAMYSISSSAAISHYKAFIYLVFSSVLFQGVWVYYYTTPPLTFSLLFFVIILKLMKRKKK